MEQLNIIYIDDKPDLSLDRYLATQYKNIEFDVNYELIMFDINQGYESLLSDVRIHSANIIFIDSLLFENNTALTGKFTGEEFKMVLQKIYPYIEVIVVTQNEVNPNIQILEKFGNNKSECTAMEYYSIKVPQYIDECTKKIKEFRVIAEKICDNDIWDKLLKEKILSTFNGLNMYESLSKKDIDKFISAFKILQEKYDV